MRYLSARKRDIANGPGTRVSLWVSGCNRHCLNCFNPEAWSFDAGNELTDERISKFIEFANSPNVEGFSILGGEPLEQNPIEMIHFLVRLKSEVNGKSIWMWTGYTFEELNADQLSVLDFVDVLVDGAFIEEMKDPNLRFRGSSNQRIINVRKSLQNKHVVLCEEYM